MSIIFFRKNLLNLSDVNAVFKCYSDSSEYSLSGGLAESLSKNYCRDLAEVVRKTKQVNEKVRSFLSMLKKTKKRKHCARDSNIQRIN